MRIIQRIKKAKAKRFARKLIIKILENPNADPSAIREYMDGIADVLTAFTEENSQYF